ARNGRRRVSLDLPLSDAGLQGLPLRGGPRPDRRRPPDRLASRVRRERTTVAGAGHTRDGATVKFARGTLLVLLALTCLLQCLEGLASLVTPAGMMAGLNLPTAAGVEVPLTFLGIS